MRRRDILTGAASGLLVDIFLRKSIAVAQNRISHDVYERAIASLPFERVETSGDKALATWQQLKGAGRLTPVILGGDEEFINLTSPFTAVRQKTAEEILDLAAALRHPQDLASKRATENVEAREWVMRQFEENSAALPRIIKTDEYGRSRELSRDEVLASMLNVSEPKIGEWPAVAPEMPELTVHADSSGVPLPRVHIGLIPTDDWTTIPAYLLWGGWNACPDPEYHVAALRAWRERFGAELVGLSADTMNLTVQRRPQTREAAIDLALEQYLYCNDIVDQGVKTISHLAAGLMAHSWWFFWWD